MRLGHQLIDKWLCLLALGLLCEPTSGKNEMLQGLRGDRKNDAILVSHDARLLKDCEYCDALKPTGITDSLAVMVSDALGSLDKCENESCVSDMASFVETIRMSEEKYKKITPDQSALLKDFIKEVKNECETKIREEQKAKAQAEKIKHGFKEPGPSSNVDPPCTYCPMFEEAEFPEKAIHRLRVKFAELDKCCKVLCARNASRELDRARLHLEEKNLLDEHQSEFCKDAIKEALDNKVADIEKAAEEDTKREKNND